MDKKDKKNNKNNKIVLFLIASLLLGFLGGAIFYFYGALYNQQIFSPELDLSSWDYNRSNFVIQDAKKVIINQDLKIEENQNYFSEAVVGIFKKSKSASDFYSFDEAILSGVVVSSDGWVLINVLGLATFDKNLIKDKSSFVVISKKDKKIYEIEDVVYSEEHSFLFLKIKDTSNLPVRPFFNFSNLKIGQSLLLYNLAGEIAPSNLLSKGSFSFPRSLDIFENELTLTEVNDSFANSFVFDLSGELVALVSADKQVRPISDFKPLIFSFFKNKEIAKFKLELEYVSLSNVVSPDNNFYSEGAWLYNNGLSAVKKGGLAEQAGLKTGDIITRVNEYKIDSNNDLFDVLNNFIIGDKLTFYILRNDALSEIKIDLK
ncbi:MAG: PDZ domain-containing protein [Patescibacteria group bacterium]|nr:PDZ domain-containing protein [Patescibacteria group bacterium]